jgi:hypothetical protein
MDSSHTSVWPHTVNAVLSFGQVFKRISTCTYTTTPFITNTSGLHGETNISGIWRHIVWLKNVGETWCIRPQIILKTDAPDFRVVQPAAQSQHKRKLFSPKEQRFNFEFRRHARVFRSIFPAGTFFQHMGCVQLVLCIEPKHLWRQGRPNAATLSTFPIPLHDRYENLWTKM